MKVFLTGATGFVGAHVARMAAEQGAELRLLTRRTSVTAICRKVRRWWWEICGSRRGLLRRCEDAMR